MPSAEKGDPIVTLAEKNGQMLYCLCYPVSLGFALGQARTALGLRVEQLADHAGLGVRSLKAYESGDRRPPMDTRLHLRTTLQALGIKALAAGRPLEKLLREVGLL